MSTKLCSRRLPRSGLARPLASVASVASVTLCALALVIAVEGTASALDPQKALTQYGVDTFRTAQGLPQNSVLALAQTRDGYLWLATYEGLVRFDGVTFTVKDKQNTPEISASWITALADDQRGGLWVGTVDGLLHLEGGKLTRDGLPSESVTALAALADQSVWIGTAGAGLLRYKDGEVTRPGAKEGYAGSIITSLSVDRRGRLWVGTSDAGLRVLSGDRFTRAAVSEGFPDAPVLRVFEEADGALWFGTRGAGAVRQKDGKNRVYGVNSGLPSDVVNDFLVDRDGNFFIGTSKGLARLKDGVFTTLSQKGGTPFQDARCLLEDAEGSVWIGTEMTGLARLRDGDFTTYSTEEGLAHNSVRSIVEDSAGSVWIATEGGGVSRLDKGVFQTYSTEDGLASSAVWGLYEDREKTLWIGTFGGSINRRVGGEIRTISKADGLPVDVVTSFAEHDGALWLGSDGLVQYKNGAFKVWGPEQGMPNTHVNALLEDKSGALWICTLTNGLGRMKDGQITFFTPKDGLAGNNAVSITEDAGGVLWVATSGGVSRVKNGVVRSFTNKEGLYDGAIHQVLDDGQGRLWMSTNKGIFSVLRADLDAFESGRIRVIPSVAYGAADGMKNAECNGGTQPSGYRTRDGRLWFATIEGVTVVDPKRLRTNPRPPPVYVERLAVDGADVALASAPVLPPGSRDVEIHYTALSMLDPSKVQFKYMLEGYDRGFNDAGTRRTAYYTNLAPGAYRFRVLAANNDGVWNEIGAAASFYLKPFFYQTTEFVSLCALAALLAAGGAYAVRVGYLKRRQAELLRHNATLAAALEQAREAVRLKGEFVANVSHELRTPLNAIVNVPEGLLELFSERAIAACGACNERFELEPGDEVSDGGACPECGAPALSPGSAHFFTGDADMAVRFLGILTRAGGHLRSLINDILDFSKLDAGEAALDLQPESAAHLFDDLSATLAPLAEPRGIEVRFLPPPPGLTLLVDPVKCRQIFTNLIGNAIKFSPDASVVEVSAAASRGAAVIRVKDRGVGVAPEHHAMIFESFQQVDGSHTRKAGGTGLGLAITKQLVELSGGDIWLESELGVGSTFFVRLPLAAGEDADGPPDGGARDGTKTENPAPAEGIEGRS